MSAQIIPSLIIQRGDAFLLVLELRNYTLMERLGVVFIAVLLAPLVTIRIGLVFLIVHPKYSDISWI
jgi:hypothetical protein